MILTAGKGRADLWETASGEHVRELKQPFNDVSDARFSPDGTHIAIASYFGSGVEVGGLRLWDTSSGHLLFKLSDGPRGSAYSVAFSPNGKFLVSGGADGTACVWKVSDGRQTLSLKHVKFVRNAEFSPDNRFIATASGDGTARLWDAMNGGEVRTLMKRSDAAIDIAFVEEGRRVAVRWLDRTIDLIDLSSEKEPARAGMDSWEKVVFGWETPQFRGASTVTTLAASPDGRRIAVGRVSGAPYIWDLMTSAVPMQLQHCTGIWSGSYSGDGSIYAGGNSDEGVVQLWDTASGKTVGKLKGPHPTIILSIAVSPDGQSVVAADIGETTWAWNTGDGRLIWSLADFRCVGVSFSSDSRSVALSGATQPAMLVDAKTGERLASVWPATTSLATFAAGGSTMVTHDREDYSFTIRDAISGKPVKSLPEHDHWHWPFLSRTGEIVATGHAGLIHVWDTRTGKELLQVPGPLEPPVAISFITAKGIAVAEGNRVSIWDIDRKSKFCDLLAYDDGSWAVVDPEGRYDSSDGGQNPNLYWVYEDPAKHILDTIGVDQVGSYFYTPGLLAKAMKREALPPVERLDKLPIFPSVGELKVEGGKATFNLTDRGGGIGQVKAFVDGQLVKTEQGRSGRNTIEIAQAGGDIQIVAYNRANTLASPRAGSTSSRANTPTTPTRYVAVIAGIESYAGPGLKPLSSAADDAVAIARSILACAQGLKITPEIYVLSSSPEAQPLKKEGVTVLPATKAQFREVFTKILPAGGKWKDSDLMILYLSGHGTTYKDGNLNHYAYYTEDARDAELGLKREEWAVTDVELVQWLAAFPGGKRAMVLDTCAAGAATELLAQAKDDADRERAMLDTNRNTGMSVLFGSADNAASWEANGHGLLTYALLQLLATESNLGGDLKDAIRVDTLFSRAETETRREAERLGLKQEPRKFGRGQDFPIGFLDEGGRKAIPYSSPVPLFSSPRLLNSATFADDLKLSDAIGAALSDIGKRGEGPNPIRYAPTATAGVLIQGGYTVAGDRVTLKMNLTPPGRARIDLPAIEGTLADVVSKAAAAIVEWARANRPVK